jgi:hypothetical protein
LSADGWTFSQEGLAENEMRVSVPGGAADAADIRTREKARMSNAILPLLLFPSCSMVYHHLIFI